MKTDVFPILPGGYPAVGTVNYTRRAHLLKFSDDSRHVLMTPQTAAHIVAAYGRLDALRQERARSMMATRQGFLLFGAFAVSHGRVGR